MTEGDWQAARMYYERTCAIFARARNQDPSSSNHQSTIDFHEGDMNRAAQTFANGLHAVVVHAR
jgi:hypothetical protein